LIPKIVLLEKKISRKIKRDKLFIAGTEKGNLLFSKNEEYAKKRLMKVKPHLKDKIKVVPAITINGKKVFVFATPEK